MTCKALSVFCQPAADSTVLQWSPAGFGGLPGTRPPTNGINQPEDVLCPRDLWGKKKREVSEKKTKRAQMLAPSLRRMPGDLGIQ
jgi:hypothetical protein